MANFSFTTVDKNSQCIIVFHQLLMIMIITHHKSTTINVVKWGRNVVSCAQNPTELNSTKLGHDYRDLSAGYNGHSIGIGTRDTGTRVYTGHTVNTGDPVDVSHVPATCAPSPCEASVTGM